MLQELPALCERRKCSEGLSPPCSREAVYPLPGIDMGPPVVIILGEHLIPCLETQNSLCHLHWLPCLLSINKASC